MHVLPIVDGNKVRPTLSELSMWVCQIGAFLLFGASLLVPMHETAKEHAAKSTSFACEEEKYMRENNTNPQAQQLPRVLHRLTTQ